MQANSRTLIAVTNGIITVSSSETVLDSINLILDLGKKALLEQGKADEKIELPTADQVAALAGG